jgi:hypothetical protein
MEDLAMSKCCFAIQPATLFVLVAWFAAADCSAAGGPPPAARDTPQGELHSTVAKVIYPNGLVDPSIRAQLEPGPFTVPKGYVATKFRYHFADPKTGFEHDKVTATTIYSVKNRRYVAEAKDSPNIILPAGEYKVVCGGLPEATGVLTYSLIREDLATSTDGVVKSPPKTSGDKPTKQDSRGTRDPIVPGGEGVLLNLPKDFDVVLPEIDYSKNDIKHFPGSTTGTADGPFVLRFRGEKVTGDQHWTAYVRQKGENPNIVEWQYWMKFDGTLRRGVLQGRLTWYYEGGIRTIRYPEWQARREWELFGQSDVDGKMTVRWVIKAQKSLLYDFDKKVMVDNPLDRVTGDSRSEFRLPIGELQASQKFVAEGKVPPMPGME